MCSILCDHLLHVSDEFYFMLQRPHKATQDEMTKFHSDDYIRFIRSIRPDNMNEYNKQMQKCEYPVHPARQYEPVH